MAEGRRGKCVSEEKKIETTSGRESRQPREMTRKEGRKAGAEGSRDGESGGERGGERRGRLREAEGGCERTAARENRSACPLCHPPINTLPLL